MPTASSAPVVERDARVRAIERLEELLPLVTAYSHAIETEWDGAVLDTAQMTWIAESGIPRQFAALEIRACIERFRANMAGRDAPEGVTEEAYIATTLGCFTDAAARLSHDASLIGPAFVKRMIRLLTDPTAACPALRWD